MPSATMAKPRTQSKPQTKKQAIKHQSQQKPDQKHNIQQQQHSWAVVRGLLQTCKHSNSHTQQNQQQESLKKQKQKQAVVVVVGADNKKSNKKMKCSGSLCSNTKVMHRPDQSQNQTPSPHQLHKKRSHSSSTSSSSLSSTNNNEASSTSSSSSRSIKLAPQNNNNDLAIVTSSSSSSSLSASSSSSNSFRGMPFRRFSTCYECRMVVDPVLGLVKSDPSLRPTICSCPHCGQVFMKPESLELHQALRHAVSELGPEDTSKNIVEIIFQSSWVHHQTNNNNNNNNNNNKQHIPCPRIDRVLKMHNTQTTIANFESYREAVKSKARPAAATRCAADGNELLRFRAAAFACTLGLNGSTALCGAAACGACAVIRSGFGPAGPGILTTATSGRAHAAAADADADAERRRAMVVCRVIAGRVKKSSSLSSSSSSSSLSSCNNVGLEEYDSVAGESGLYSNLDELYVFNPKAILPCFLVIYSAF